MYNLFTLDCSSILCRFQCECTFGEDTFEPGYGANKKEAKLAAAKIALKTLKITFDGRFSAQKHCISSPDYEDNLYRNNTTDATSPFDRAGIVFVSSITTVFKSGTYSM